MRRPEVGLAIDPAFLLEFRQRTAVGIAEHPVDVLALAHGEAGMARAEARGEPGNHLVIGAAFARAARSASARGECTGGRHPGRCRRARETSSPAARCRPSPPSRSSPARARRRRGRRGAKPRLTFACSGATDTGLVFWIEHRRHRRAAEQGARPRRRGSRRSATGRGGGSRDRGCRCPSIIVLSRPKMAPLVWKAPPPS